MRHPIRRPPKRRAVISGAKPSQRDNRRWQGFAEKIFPITQLTSRHGAINAVFWRQLKSNSNTGQDGAAPRLAFLRGRERRVTARTIEVENNFWF